jgi:hypothetical protein
MSKNSKYMCIGISGLEKDVHICSNIILLVFVCTVQFIFYSLIVGGGMTI